MRVLVVDDRFQSRWGIADWLTAFLHPVAVESAASAAEALAALAKRKPDLVLAAHPMLDVDGTGLARQIKSQGDAPMVIVMKRHLQARPLAFLQSRFSLRVLRQSPL